ncbi:hypothetical protein, partial [Alistipes ihumii]|uniref:hypothetical protein n=1 Tax=Alistipes ihumii TaxID=1470347 RepID=UPI003AB6E617
RYPARRIPGPSDFQERCKCLAVIRFPEAFRKKRDLKSRHDSVPERPDGPDDRNFPYSGSETAFLRAADVPAVVQDQSVAMRSSFG